MRKITPARFFYPSTRHVWLFFLACSFFSCNNTEQKPPEVVVVKIPEKIDEKVNELVKTDLEYIAGTKGKLNDSVMLLHPDWVNKIYDSTGFRAIWSSDEKWNTLADSLYVFIRDSKLYGLFPSDYNLPSLANIRNGIASDSLHKKNAALWAKPILCLRMLI